MQYQELKRYFAQQVFPSKPNEWEFEDVLLEIETLTDDQQTTLMEVVPTVWPISQNLCHSVLTEGVRHAADMTQQNRAEWLRQILFHYESGGLIDARSYMARAEIDSVLEENEEHHVALNNLLARLTPFARGLSGVEVTLKEAEEPYTDTETIFLPATIDLFPESRQNFQFYKFLVAVQCGIIHRGSVGKKLYSAYETLPYQLQVEGVGIDCLKQYENQTLAADIYQILETDRVILHLHKQYPGLIRQSTPLLSMLLQERSTSSQEKELLMERLFISALSGTLNTTCKGLLSSDVNDMPAIIAGLYQLVEQRAGGYQRISFLPFMGRFNFTASETKFTERVSNNKKKFETRFGALVPDLSNGSQNQAEQNSSSESLSSALLQVSNGSSNDQKKSRAPQVVINNKPITLPDTIIDLVNAIQKDLGTLPESYVSSAFGLSGGGRNSGIGEVDDDESAVGEFLPYDEWDYRRQGYRKDWCSLRERELTGIQSDFISNTLEKYRGQLKSIKNQFELMYTQERFARRRRSGDDIDLDALIDSLGDQHAGLPPSENLFIKLIRDQRSISTLFLVDMSNSTEGWVGQSIKEALLLLCEAMEIIGDGYGIYGFSGMRRMRSEVYRIKQISESYNEAVKQRLSAIGPKEYTRMGPPIRHMINQFKYVDTKTRLLLILSDGKPEDYDDYKHQYAIEDTRKALAEARGQSIHTYCITIDKQAHEYLDHLFGSGNYAFIPNIELLPARLTEIYRLLTK